MELDVSKLPSWIQKILKKEDNALGFLVMWFLGLTIFPTGGFYIGTIASNSSDKIVNGVNIPHFYDLRLEDIHNGGYGALIGLGLGICLGLYGTIIYPRFKEQDAIEDAETADRIHKMSGHHDDHDSDH